MKLVDIFKVVTVLFFFETMPMSPVLYSAPLKTIAKVVAAGIRAQRNKNEKLPEETGEENKENISPRSNELQNVYTRNYPKLSNLVSQREPQRNQPLLQEARSLTPYLSYVHYQQYPTTASNPGSVSPTRSTEKHVRKRKLKLSPEDIQRARRRYTPMEHWSYDNIAPYGYTVQQRDELIDPFQTDEEGITNLEHMIHGNAPLGPDLTRINLHHWLRQDPGPLAELSGTFHRRETGPLHGVESVGIRDRIPFDQFRRMYWEARAYDILESMGLTP